VLEINSGINKISLKKDDFFKSSKNTTWDEIFYELYVVKKIEEGLRAEEEGKLIPYEK